MNSHSVYAEPGVDAADVAVELAAELKLMADWMDLGVVAVNARGDLSPALAAVVG